MKRSLMLMILGLFLSSAAMTKTDSMNKVFKENHVTLHQVKTIHGEKNYFVDLPFDPRIGTNSNHLEAEIVANNGCKSFVLVSPLDQIKIHLIAKRTRKGCSLNEKIEPIK